MNTKPPLIIIAGPTASGKSALALALSRLLPVTIINADASQVYRDLRIVSARPSPEDEKQAPHRLFGHIDGSTACSAAGWAVQAREEIAAAHAETRIPLLVGGSGLYLKTLLEGIAPVPEIPPELRAQVRDLPVAEAGRELAELDPEAAARLGPADRARIARALEVVRATGRTLSDWQQDRHGGIDGEVAATGIVLLPPRDWLRARCNKRFARMLDCGAIDEVQALAARHLDPALPVMRAIGVREILAIINEPVQRDVHVEAGKAATRQYAKRQYTWFRHQTPAGWLRTDAKLENENINELAIKYHDMILTR